MPPRDDKTQLKRPLGSLPEDETESKKPRRSNRLANGVAAVKTPVSNKRHLPSPVTNPVDETAGPSTSKDKDDEVAVDRNAQGNVTPCKAEEQYELSQALSSPPQDTQPMSQFNDPNVTAEGEEEEDGNDEGIWGYLVTLDSRYGDKPLVLRKRNACPSLDQAELATEKKDDKSTPAALRDEEAYERTSTRRAPSGGYLIGRHPECDVVVNDQIISNRHCLIFAETKGTDTVVMLKDLSRNGTFVNEAIVGRNQCRELEHNDEIAVHGKARFVFRYPRNRQTNGFHQQYSILEKLGKGHFAEVYMSVDKSSGQRYAVKIFGKHASKPKNEVLQQEIGVLMSVSHPNVLCLRDTFSERDRVYLVLELAPEGELFNYIVTKQRLSEDETRKLFTQLFKGIKYLHERNIVHRDIKPENILLMDKNLHVKLADFGLAKIIGEESFTTTLCGTPSYVAPEILADSKQRKYTKAVDIWSLGVVLYICLCGFPPFSDELYSRDFPYTLSQQIKSGRFEYPSPYWDSVGDPALDLIDSMLIVDPDRRFTIDQCLAHPWINQTSTNVDDSTDGLVGGLAGLEVHRRGPVRERTLLSKPYSAQVAATVTGNENRTAKVSAENNEQDHIINASKEEGPAHNRAPAEFMEMGGKGDQALFENDDASIYPDRQQATKANQDKSAAAEKEAEDKGQRKIK